MRVLLDLHLAFAHEHSPPEDVHALAPESRRAPGLEFFTIRDAADRRLLAVGALRVDVVEPGHAEVKAMHTTEAARRRGLGRTMLDHLLAAARAKGCTRVSLETGTQPVFAPARALYESAGFRPCPPFGEYVESPNSVCMTRLL